MKVIIRAVLLTLIVCSTASGVSATLFTNLYSFSPASVANPALVGSYGGISPQAALLLSGNTLFGTTAYGGSNNLGTIFSINAGENVTNGGANSVITNLHTFSGRDGAIPLCDLVQSGNCLFGTTSGGGSNGAGTVFALNADGTGFTNLFSFAYTNGGNPQAGLVLCSNTLYGTTANGGAYGAGTIFTISTNGSGFITLYNFNYTNGANPGADLLLLGDTLYGTTEFGGGSNGLGTVFAINTDGTGFTNLYVFSWTNGANPFAGLALVSNVLCGTTYDGGRFGVGTVFLIGTNGTGFSTLYNFGSSSTDGNFPSSSIVVSSNGASSYSLYGTTRWGDQVFEININGLGLSSPSYVTNYSLQSSSGGQLMAGVILSSNILYGTASIFGYNGGSIFSMTTSGGSFNTIHNFEFAPYYDTIAYADTNSDGASSEAGLVLSGRTLYGTTAAGGTNGCGTIFSINTDGTGFTDLYTPGTNDSGPRTALTLSGNILYGTATALIDLGGLGSFGTLQLPEIFSLDTDGSGFTNFSNFNGNYPGIAGNLILSSNTLYGALAFAGTTDFTDAGGIFAVNTDGTGYTNLYIFSSSSPELGMYPDGGLVLSGNMLYGTTESGGDNNFGTVFAVNTDGTGFTDLHVFNGNDGCNPLGSLVLCGHTLYGVTYTDINRNCGTIFAVNTDGSGFTNLYALNGYDGDSPLAGLLLSGDTLYGTTSTGGNGGYGTVFSIKTNGACFTTLHNFSGAGDGATPYDGLILSGNTLYGTTSSGGTGGNGTVFALSLGPIPLCVEPEANNVVLTWGNPVFTLQSGPAADGHYTNVVGAVSPYTNTITGSQQFFRLQAP